MMMKEPQQPNHASESEDGRLHETSSKISVPWLRKQALQEEVGVRKPVPSVNGIMSEFEDDDDDDQMAILGSQ